MTHCCLRSRGLIETYLSLKIANMESQRESNYCPQGCSSKHFYELLTQEVDIFVIILSWVRVNYMSASWGKMNRPEVRLKKKWRKFKAFRAVKHRHFLSARCWQHARDKTHTETRMQMCTSAQCVRVGDWDSMYVFHQCDMWHPLGV